MQNNPLMDWQRLTEVYKGMYDDELLALAADSNDLTETARQVLRDEMKKRNLNEPRATDKASSAVAPPVVRDWEPGTDLPSGDTPSRTADGQEQGSEAEFTWKVRLCECETSDQLWQLREVLRRASIESWVEGHGGRYVFGLNNPVVMVAADQIDHAREIAAQPIPQDIVEASKAPPEEFELPTCPQCGAADPTLEGVDPTNAWLCEACGQQWTEPAEVSG